MQQQTMLYMSVSDALKRYGVSRSSLYLLFRESECPALKKFGKKTLIPVNEFDRFFEAHLRPAE